MSERAVRSGYIAIVGRPNAGKSTLLNALVGQKISITSRRVQTTRQMIAGIVTRGPDQFVFLDTPGFQTEYRSALTQAMARGLQQALAQAQAVLWLIDASASAIHDDALFRHLADAPRVIVALNKADKKHVKNQILTLIAQIDVRYHPQAIVPISARNRWQLDILLDALAPHLAPQPFLFAEDEITTASVREIAAELIREKLFRQLGQELPYATAVQIESFEELPQLTRIHAVVLVDKPGQKAIVIGKGGEKLKEIGTAARKDIETLIGKKVFLQLFVKVKQAWAEDRRTLARLGLA